MRLIISLLLILTFSLSKAQSSNTVARTEEYVMVIAYEKALGNLNMNFSLDFGQDLPPSMTADIVKNENKKLERFKSIVDVLNYMNQKGWVFVNTYQMKSHSGLYYHYLLKKTITN